MDAYNCKKNNVNHIFYTNFNEQSVNVNQEIYIWNESSETIKRILEQTKEIEGLIYTIMSDYKEFKDKTFNQLSKQNHVNKGLSNDINKNEVVQIELTDWLRELQEQLDKLNSNKGSLIRVLKTLASNDPVSHIIINGVPLSVSNFISINENDIVYFKSNEKLKIIDGHKIDGIEF